MVDCVIPFYFGLGSRYSYLVASQLDRIEAEWNCRFEWLPLQSGALIRRANQGRSPFQDQTSSQDQAPSGQYDWDYRQRDAEAWAEYYGIPYREPEAFRVDPADLAKACWAADREDRLVAMARRVFQAIFTEAAVITPGLLGDFAEELGLDRKAFLEDLESTEVNDRHEAALLRALGDGAFGVPSFVLDGRLFWGNDRLPLLERALAKRG